MVPTSSSLWAFYITWDTRMVVLKCRSFFCPPSWKICSVYFTNRGHLSSSVLALPPPMVGSRCLFFMSSLNAFIGCFVYSVELKLRELRPFFFLRKVKDLTQADQKSSAQRSQSSPPLFLSLSETWLICCCLFDGGHQHLMDLRLPTVSKSPFAKCFPRNR